MQFANTALMKISAEGFDYDKKGDIECELPVIFPPKVNITMRQSRQSGVARATCPD